MNTVKKTSFGLLAALLAIGCMIPGLAIASDSTSSAGMTNENYNSPSVFVPAVANNDSQRLPENCNQEVKAVGTVRITQNGDQVNVNGSGGRGNLGHKYDTSKWCIVVIGTHRDGDVIAMSRSQENTGRPAPGIKFGRIASVGSGRIH